MKRTWSNLLTEVERVAKANPDRYNPFPSRHFEHLTVTPGSPLVPSCLVGHALKAFDLTQSERDIVAGSGVADLALIDFEGDDDDFMKLERVQAKADCDYAWGRCV